MQARGKRSRSEASQSGASTPAAPAVVRSAAQNTASVHSVTSVAASARAEDSVLLPAATERRTRARMATAAGSNDTNVGSGDAPVVAVSPPAAQVLPTSQPSTFVRTDEVIRLMLDTLNSLGYAETARTLMRECSVAPTFDATACRDAVIEGDWPTLMRDLHAVPLKHSGDLLVLLLAIMRQRYLELLEAGDPVAAVRLLQQELQPTLAVLRRATGDDDAGAATGPTPARFSSSVSFPPLVSLSQPSHRRDATGSVSYARILGVRGNDNVLLESDAPPCDAVQAGGLPGSVGHAFEVMTQAGSILFGATPAGVGRGAAGEAAQPTVATSASTAADADLWAVVDSDDEESEGSMNGSTLPAASPSAAAPLPELIVDCCNGVRVAVPQDMLIMHAPSAGRTLAPVEGMRIGTRRIAYVTPLDDLDCRYLRAASVHTLAHEETLNDMSALTLPATAAALRAAAGWPGVEGGSRLSLLHLLERRLRPDVVPPLRLPVLLGQAVAYQRSQCALHNSNDLVPSLLHDHACGADVLPSACMAVLTGHECEVWGARFSPDGSRCASFGRDGSILIWSIHALRRMHMESTYSSWASLTSWERSDVSARAAPIHVDAHASGIVSVSTPPAAPPSPARAAHAEVDEARSVMVVRLRTQDVLSQLHDGTPASPPPIMNVCASTDSCLSVAWHPDGNMLLSAGTRCSAVWLWDTHTGGLLAAFDTSQASGIVAVEWVQLPAQSAQAFPSPAPASHFMCAAADGGVWLFAVPAGCTGGQLIRTAAAHWRTPPVYTLACVRPTASPQAAAASFAPTSPPSSPVSSNIAHTVNPACVVVALCQDAAIYIIHAADATAPVLEQDVSMCGFRPVGLALDSRARYALIACQAPPPHPSVRPGSRTLGGQPPRPPAVLRPPSRVLSLPPGTRAGSRSRPPTSATHASGAAPARAGPSQAPERSLSTLLHEVLAGAAAATTGAARDAPASAASHMDASGVGVGSYDEPALAEGEHAAQMVLWDMTMAAPVAVYRGHVQQRFVHAPCFGGSGDAVAAIGSEDGVLHLWHREQASEVARLRGHVGAVNTVSWSSSDASLVVTASDDGSVRLWGPCRLQCM